jgi:integrase
VTFGTFFKETYLPQVLQDKKPHTTVNEEGLYRRNLCETIGALPFNEISAFQLERIKKDMTDAGLSARTVQYALQIVRQVFNVAKKLGVFTGEPPTRNIRWPRIDNMKLRYLSADEAERLLEALAKRSQTLRDMTLLSLHSWLRFSEIANLKWSCVNWDAGTLSILNAKSGSRIT